jgi:hypothetical protein
MADAKGGENRVDRVEYPASLSIEYPELRSRRLALVKSWLLAVPHYLIVAAFIGGLAH